MPSKIILIRHAEKPTAVPPVAGVSENGTQDARELTVRGWQRAGALIRYFVPANRSFTDSRLAKPDIIFAAGAASQGESLRPQHTVLPLARFLGGTLDLSHRKGNEVNLAAALLQAEGVVLCCWQHEGIPAIANRILGKATCPQTWPEDRFDMAWIFDPLRDGGWSFVQIPQMLLEGDKANPI
jgi:hypothetical protein